MLYKEYLDKINEIMGEAAQTQADAIEESARLIADAIAGGGLLHVFGCGHSQMYAMEVFYRAGGLVPVNAIIPPVLSLSPKAFLSTFGERVEGLAEAILKGEPVKEGDVMFIASTSARNNVPVEMAIEAKKRGLKVILLYSTAFAGSVASRHASGKLADAYSDVVLDNCGISGDGVMEIEGVDAKFGPTSSVVGFALLQAVIVQTVENLHKKGVKPPIWVSSNLDRGDAINRAYIDQYSSRVTCL